MFLLNTMNSSDQNNQEISLANNTPLNKVANTPTAPVSSEKPSSFSSLSFLTIMPQKVFNLVSTWWSSPSGLKAQEMLAQATAKIADSLEDAAEDIIEKAAQKTSQSFKKTVINTKTAIEDTLGLDEDEKNASSVSGKKQVLTASHASQESDKKTN